MICRTQSRKSYTLLDNRAIYSSLSISALGLLMWCLSKPPDWHFSIAGTLAQFRKEGKKMGVTALNRLLAELQKKGHVYILPKKRGPDGKWLDVDWEVYESPDDNPHVCKGESDQNFAVEFRDGTVTENPVADNLVAESPVVENPLRKTRCGKPGRGKSGRGKSGRGKSGRGKPARGKPTRIQQETK